VLKKHPFVSSTPALLQKPREMRYPDFTPSPAAFLELTIKGYRCQIPQVLFALAKEAGKSLAAIDLQ
jgi:hypothetical protein